MLSDFPELCYVYRTGQLYCPFLIISGGGVVFWGVLNIVFDGERFVLGVFNVVSGGGRSFLGVLINSGGPFGRCMGCYI
jgi:hypothetical protein